MLLFVNFMFSNTVFIHTHTTDSGRVVAHSHPYLPSSHHNHSTQGLDLISVLNLYAASTEGTSYAPYFAASTSYLVIGDNYQTHLLAKHSRCHNLRAPPALG